MKTQAAETAKAIRSELKKAFPAIKFTVKSRNFSMGDAVNISYFNGPLSSEIEAITDKYQYGCFNGMEDIYENSNCRNDIPQAKYVHVNRRMTEDIIQKINSDLENYYEGYKESGDYFERFRAYKSNLIWRRFCEMSF